MEFLYFLVAVTVLLLVVSIRNSLTTKFNVLQQKIDDLSSELKRLQTGAVPLRQEKKPDLATDPVAHAFPVAKPGANAPVEDKSVKLPGEIVVFPEVISAPQIQQAAPLATPKKPGFFERNPDLEKFIGENLANKIGIGILVLGIGFFVKYAIDQDWINEIGRVCIGICCGGILLGIAHRMRKSFVGFSSVLVGGGIAILYLTIAIAFHEYGIFSQTAAFFLMLVITAFTVVLSLGYNRMELAILSILGGFTSPFMVSTGEGNYVILFVYVLILDCGMLALAYHKKWNPVNIICYAFTVLLFGSWLATRFNGEQYGMVMGALGFATAFYLVFFAMNVVNNIKEKTAFKAIEISMLLSNTFFYYGAGMVALDNVYGSNFKGLFTALLGVFNFVFAFALYRNRRIDKNLVFLLIGLVLTFISLAAPVQLEGNYITLFWAAETVLLLWLSQKSGIRLMKLASMIIMALMIISLMLDWEQIYFDEGSVSVLPVVFNKAYITGLFAIAAIVAVVYLLRFEQSEKQAIVQRYKSIIILGGLSVLYFSQWLELRHQLFSHGVDYAAQNIIIGCYNFLFILMILWSEKRLIMHELIRKGFPFICFLAIFLYLSFYHQQILTARNEYLYGESTFTGFAFHYVLIALLIAVTVLGLRKIQQLTAFNARTHNLYSWVYVFFYLFIASAELDHTVLLSAYTPEGSSYGILNQNHKIGFPILWGLTSFLLIAIGLKTKKKHLRIISLTLFLITLLKLFIIDIRGISEGGKIAAFISLGVLLLIVSFMYQRLKKLLLADEVVAQKKGEV